MNYIIYRPFTTYDILCKVSPFLPQIIEDMCVYAYVYTYIYNITSDYN